MLATKTRRLEKQQQRPIRNGLICAFVVAACLWATYPVAEIGINDDWSYIKTAQVFAQTGHIVYNGWATAMLGWQIVWSALFIRLFGFSFTAVRLSILPIAMATIFLFHAILLRFGVNSRNAVLGALTLGLSMQFVPLAVTYMTDVPGLFVIFLCLSLCQRATAADTSKATIAWLCLAAATNVVGGTARQIAWLGVLVMVPSTGWLLRRRRGVLLTSFMLWVLSAATVLACMRWFARQPYSMPDSSLKDAVFDPAAPAFHLFLELLGIGLCLPLLIYPVLVAWLPQVRKLSGEALVRIGLILMVYGVFRRLAWKWTLPWLPGATTYEFAVTRTDLLLGPGPLVIPMWARETISLLVVVAALILLERVSRSVQQPLRSGTAPVASWRVVLWLLGPFTLSYFALLMPDAYHRILLDRYTLPLMAVAIICLLKLQQQLISDKLSTLSVISLAVFAVVVIAGTHDWFAWSRARVAAIDEVRASGVPRTEIQGGFEYDGWTQIELAGEIDAAQFIGHVEQGQPSRRATHAATNPACQFQFSQVTPAIDPQFTTIFPKRSCLAPSQYPVVTYRTWLPPFKGTILVQKIPNGPG